MFGWDVATGKCSVAGGANFTTGGEGLEATHTNAFVSLTSSYVPEFPVGITPSATATMVGGYVG